MQYIHMKPNCTMVKRPAYGNTFNISFEIELDAAEKAYHKHIVVPMESVSDDGSHHGRRCSPDELSMPFCCRGVVSLGLSICTNQGL
jgi:hypothetical protein